MLRATPMETIRIDAPAGERAREGEDDEPLVAAGEEARRPSHLLIAAGIALLVVIAFFPAVRCGFVAYDDPQGVARLAPILRGLSWDNVRWAFAETDFFANWMPLTILSHMLDWQLYGENAAGHHLSSVVLHAGAVALLFLLFARTTGQAGRAAAVALLWGLHPLRVEPVAWIAARKDVLSAFLAMLTLFLYARWAERRTAGRYVAVMGVFALALLSKSMVMTLPGVMLLLDVWPLRQLSPAAGGGVTGFARELWPRVREKLPLLVMAAAIAALAFATQRLAGAMPDVAAVPLRLRLANAALAVPRYLASTFWPVRLSAFYPLRDAMPSPVAVTLSLLLLVALTLGALLALRRAPWLPVGWLWFLGMLLPVLGIVQVGDASHADRYTYLPGIGLTLAVVWMAGEALSRAGARAIAIAAAVVLTVGCAVATRAQLAYWRDSEALFRRMIAIDPDNHVGHLDLGPILEARGQVDEAIAHYGLAIAARPDLSRAWSNLGSALASKHDLPGAEAALRRAIAISPDLVGAHFNLAIIYDDEGKPGPAAGHLAKVIATEPTYARAWLGLRDLLARPDGARVALPWIRAVARTEPQSHELQELVRRLEAQERAAPPR